MTTAPPSDRFIDTLTTDLATAEIDAGQLVAGGPAVAAARFADIGEIEIGVWEHTPGTSIDVEVDEVFLVLAGNGTVTFDTGEVVGLVPGRLVRLHAGERTTWTVRETLRKVYVTA
jgi:uncharacterized protein